mmetsp:Transcript_5690/g.14435  ORF Transcript_5690/g.14435 Transcript_5690/m.14435 type:complete len:258 (-) Transcript_5690:399-1172(-)
MRWPGVFFHEHGAVRMIFVVSGMLKDDRMVAMSFWFLRSATLSTSCEGAGTVVPNSFIRMRLLLVRRRACSSAIILKKRAASSGSASSHLSRRRNSISYSVTESDEAMTDTEVMPSGSRRLSSPNISSSAMYRSTTAFPSDERMSTFCACTTPVLTLYRREFLEPSCTITSPFWKVAWRAHDSSCGQSRSSSHLYVPSSLAPKKKNVLFFSSSSSSRSSSVWLGPMASLLRRSSLVPSLFRCCNHVPLRRCDAARRI